MKKIFIGLVTVVFLMTLGLDASAQFNRNQIRKNNKRIATYRGKKHFGREKVYSGVGFSINALNYFGDLSPLPSKLSTDISFTKPGFGISFFHRFGPRYTLIGQFMYGTLKGSDAESAATSSFDSNSRHLRNLSFRNQIKELTIVAVFDLFENNGTYISRVKWTPYVFVGGSLFLQNPQAIAPPKYLDGSADPYAGQWVDLQPLGTEGQYSTLLQAPSNGQPGDVNFGIKPYSLLQFAIPFGVGARFRLNEVLDLWADIGFRYTFTDYLDDVSKNYVDLAKIQAKDPSMTKLAQAMSYRTNELGANGTTPPSSPYTYTTNGQTFTVQSGYGSEYKDNWRGHSNANDIFMVTSIKVTYILGATFHRAKFR